ncbi:MAG: DinB family protein [Ignavibacteria bacterium]|nr:DinB family protein [Ignavibacteria bacterium]
MTIENSNPQISLLKWMLEDVRTETIKGVNHLTKGQLFQPPVKDEFPIGAYLMHIAEVDISWLEIISGIEQSDELKRKSYFDKWFDSRDNYDPPKEAPEIKDYFDIMERTRKNFLDYVSTLDDSQLEDEVILKRKKGDVKFPKKWIIYHILEHEAHTRGQMFMLIRKAGWNKIRQN